ncbi:MAG: alcohol dehydrogenase catalytic domain-containing protein [Woeseiaceae bacterium]|nr:alcohol dehydrogenase catalytic domain-containing protein [Woeseiaceae bacterium]
MKAAVYVEKSSPLVLKDLPKPEPAPGQLRIRVKACGVCGSDIHASEADWTPTGIVMGHEFAGVVDAVGEGVTRWRPGDRVAPLAQISCGGCDACRAGDEQPCENPELIDYNPERGGAYAEYTIVGARDALPLPDALSFEEAAAVEPLAVGLDAVRRARLTEDDSVLIIGGGPIGLSITQWARFFGARDVVVSELNPARLKIAEAMRATGTIDASSAPDTIEAFVELTGRKPTVIIEAVGVPSMIQRCIEMAKPESRIVVVGVCQATDTFEPMQCILKSLTLIFAYGYSTDDYAYIIELLGSGQLTAKPLISHRVSLDELPAAFEALRRPGDQIKVIVEP